MNYEIVYTDVFSNNVEKLSEEDQRLVFKTINRKLRINPFYSSLCTKKIKGQIDLYESRVNRDMRLTWRFDGEKIAISNVGHHDILKRY
jgi:mRNA-degrading endonuclease RelE of RelBE toxin-antitoxin system